MKIGLMQGRLSPINGGKIQSFPWKNWLKEIEISKNLSFKFLEWTLDYPNFRLNPIFNKKISKKIQGININSITCDFFMQKPFFKSKRNKDLISDFNFFLKKIKNSQIKILVIPLVDNSSIKNKKIENKVISFFLNYKDWLKKNNKKIAFESDYNPKKLKKFIENFPSQQFGINYDLGNSSALNFNLNEEFKYYHNRIINIHIKDRIINGNTTRLGAGNANFKKFIKNYIKYKLNTNLILQTARSSNQNHILEIIKNRIFLINKFKEFGHHP
mgnify:FL=1|jgi:L-ribulose-5-phosphate 3-epimerase